jgi:flagellar biosynthesis protein FlhF
LLADREVENQRLKLKEREQQLEIYSQSRSLQEMQVEIGRLRKLFEGEMAQLVWRESHDRQPNRMALLSRLEMTGINHDLATRLVDKVLPCDDLGLAWQKVIRILLKTMGKSAPDPLEDGGVIALIGSTGVGKTTTAVKLAAGFARKYGRNQVALITTDDYRVGQREQLLSLGSSLGLSVQVAASQEEMRQAMESFAERKLLIIDTAGISQRQQNFREQLELFLEGERKVSPYLVLSATVQESVTNETIRAFSDLNPVAAIVTKTDENVSIGPMLSSLIRFRLPVAYVGTGQEIPDDLIRADGEFFTDKIRESYRHAMAQTQRRRKASA